MREEVVLVKFIRECTYLLGLLDHYVLARKQRFVLALPFLISPARAAPFSKLR
jgi:hypothetical protein